MKAKEYLARPYARVITPDTEAGTYVAEILEFPGCFTEADSPEEALRALEEVAEEWIAAARKSKQRIPEPLAGTEYSGKLVLRLPKSVHERAARYATRESVSLNQFLVSAISEKVGALEG